MSDIWYFDVTSSMPDAAGYAAAQKHREDLEKEIMQAFRPVNEMIKETKKELNKDNENPL